MKVAVNKKLLPMKAHYFLFNAGTAPVVPFMPTLARQLGFSSVVVGTMYTILPVIGMLAKPLFGVIADRFQRHKLLFLLAQLITAISFFCIMFIPSISESPPTVEFHCHGGESDVRFCPQNTQLDTCIEQNLENRYANQTIGCNMHCKAEPWMWNIICSNWNVTHGHCTTDKPYLDFVAFVDMKQIEVVKSCLYFLVHKGNLDGKNTTMFCPKNATYFKASCEIDCNDKFITSTLVEGNGIENKDVMNLYQFWLFFCLLITSWAGMAVVVSVGDAICFEMLGERHYLYGNQRLWGAVGWGLFSIISGVLVDEFSGGSVIKDYTVVFWMTLIIIGMDMLTSTKLQHTQTKLSTNILQDVGKIFLSLRVIIFFVWCILVGLCTALIWNFLFWHLEDLGSQSQGCDNKNFMKTLQGLAMGIQCFGGELPFFFLSGWILKKIGHIHAMSLVLLGFGVRFMLYSLLQNPWWVLPIEFMNGITFGIFYSTMASYASIVAPPGTEATLQGLVGAVFEGVGVSVGSFIGGLLFKLIGGSKTFEIFGICAFVAFFIHALVQWLMKKYNEKYGTSNYLPPTDAMHMLDDQDISVPF